MSESRIFIRPVTEFDMPEHDNYAGLGGGTRLFLLSTQERVINGDAGQHSAPDGSPDDEITQLRNVLQQMGRTVTVHEPEEVQPVVPAPDSYVAEGCRESGIVYDEKFAGGPVVFGCAIDVVPPLPEDGVSALSGLCLEGALKGVKIEAIKVAS